MKTGLIENRWMLLTAALAGSALLTAARAGTEVTVRGRIMQEVRDGVYLDAGTDRGLRPARTGTLHLDDGRTFGFEVLSAEEESSLLRLTGYRGPQGLVGRIVETVFTPEALPQGEKKSRLPQDPNKAAGSSEKSVNPDVTRAFVPLLAPVAQVSEVSKPPSTSHGRIQVRQTFQTDAEGHQDYAVTRAGSSGRLDRIASSPWSFEWSGDLRYRTGEAYVSHPDYQEPHLDVYRAMFQHPLGEGEFLRLGRFVPYELPLVGYVDGVQGQVHPGKHLQLGAVAGLKPGRYDLEASADEPLVVPYATYATGPRDGHHYSGTVGLLNSYYEGDLDRLALLFDQRAGWGRALTLYSTAVVDFDVGASETRTGTRLTQLDVSGVSELSSFLSLRAGVDHWERPDHQAEIALLPFPDERFFDNGYWRYWVGSSQNVPWNLRLYEEVGYITSDTVEGGVRWQVSLTRSGLGPWRQASTSVTVYNLMAYGDDGYGCRISGYLPLHQGAVMVQPAAGFRVLRADSQSQDLSLSYLSLDVDGRLSRNWSAFGDATYFRGDNADSILFEFGLRFAW